MLKLLQGKKLYFEDYCILFYKKESKYLDIVEKAEAERDWMRIVAYLLHIGALQ